MDGDRTETAEPRGCPTPGACSALAEIERLRAAIQQHAGKQRHTSLSTPADIELYEAAGL